MDKLAYREINFDSIILGTLISADCGGIMKCSKTEFCFQIIFVSEQNEDFKINIEIVDIKKIFKKHNDKLLVLDFKLKPSAIRNIGDSIKNSDFIFQISKNSDECKFQLYLNDITTENIAFIDKFFSSIDVFDENVAKVVKPEQPEQQQTSKIPKSNLLKHRKKKFLDSDPEDGSQDYHPQKRQRKQSFSKTTADCEVIEDTPKRSLRVRNRDEVNLCEDMSEEAQLQEALKRSLKGVDQTVIESLSLIDDQKSAQDLEHDELYDNVDKTIELFTYNTSNGDLIVRMEDYLCLSRNEYLSDVIIDFYLHYIYNVKMTPEQREKTLIIGTHFYTLYATSSEYSGWNDGLNAGLNAKEKRYRRIDGIIKDDVNIFDKDYIIMPLMDHNHWFLAIVCFPKLNGSYTIDGNNRVDENDIKRNPKKVYQPPIKSSCIIIFDSVKGNGSRRTVAINHIKNFLEYEWMNKYQHEFQFDVKSLNGHSAKVPLQMNNVDCGCFILEFMERFFVTSPIEDMRFPIDLGDWFSSDEVRCSKRREIAEVIKNMMESTDNEVELPKIRFYGDRKRRASKSVQFIDLDKSFEADNGNVGDGFRIPENGNNIENGNDNDNENGSNGNNNDENFNNNNDFNCLDSNNTLQNGSVIQEMQEAVQNIPIDGQFVDANIERITTQEIMDYQQEACLHELDDEIFDEAKTGSAETEMEVDQTPQIETVQAGNSQDEEMANVDEMVPNVDEMVPNVDEIENDSKFDELKNDSKVDEMNSKGDEMTPKCDEMNSKVDEMDSKLFENNAQVLEDDTKLDELDPLKSDIKENQSDSEVYENDAQILGNDVKVNKSDASIAREKTDSDIEILNASPEKIDLTADDFDDDVEKEEPNNQISGIKHELNKDPGEQSNDQESEKKEQENQTSENVQQSIVDRLSQSITLKETIIVLLD